MVLSKAIGGSLPLAVIVYRAELDVWAPGAHAGTFRGNQLAMAAGTATLAYVRENGLAERAATLGDRMLAALRGLIPAHPCVGDVRGRGLMIGVELIDPDTGAAAPGLAAAVRRECLDRGLIVELGGRHSSVVRLLPPLTVTDEQATAVLDRLADAIPAAGRRPPLTRTRRTPMPDTPPHPRPPQPLHPAPHTRASPTPHRGPDPGSVHADGGRRPRAVRSAPRARASPTPHRGPDPGSVHADGGRRPRAVRSAPRARASPAIHLGRVCCAGNADGGRGV
ncbi:hypothetical protein GCM10020254_25660 [Streptomyces goshikiensis]